MEMNSRYRLVRGSGTVAPSIALACQIERRVMSLVDLDFNLVMRSQLLGALSFIQDLVWLLYGNPAQSSKTHHVKQHRKDMNVNEIVLK